MRVYFLSYRRAALKLCGLYVGLVDGFERSVELDFNDNVFAEIIPENGAGAINFVIDKNITRRAPEGCDVYISPCGVFIRVIKFPPARTELKVISQTRQFGCLYTVFSRGDVMLSCDGESASLTTLPDAFSSCSAEPCDIGGYPVLVLRGGAWLCIASARGKVIFLNKVKSYSFGARLAVTVGFETCAAAEAECAFYYDGEKLELVKSVTRETRPVGENLLHFAFFESVLTRGDCEKYLCGALKGSADKLKGYLGTFTGVTVPPESFYRAHGDIAAAGLVYPRGGNIYEIIYYAAEIRDGEIQNVFPVE